MKRNPGEERKRGILERNQGDRNPGFLRIPLLDFPLGLLSWTLLLDEEGCRRGIQEKKRGQESRRGVLERNPREEPRR